MTIRLDPEHELSLWTYEYAFGYLVGPTVGAMLAGVTANMIEYVLNERAELAKSKEDNMKGSEAGTSFGDISYSFGDGTSQVGNGTSSPSPQQTSEKH